MLTFAPQHFRRGIAEQPFGGGIECFDAAVRVDDDDAVDGRIDDGPPARFARAELPFEPNALGQVVEHAGELALAADPHLADRQVHAGTCVPSRRRPVTSRPMPMIFASPVVEIALPDSRRAPRDAATASAG